MSANQNDSEEVPLMFRAQVEGRCQLQRVEGGDSQVYDWVEEWTKEYPRSPKPPQPSKQPKPKKVDPLARPPKQNCGNVVKYKEYTISWRLVTDSGQDSSIIRPVFGAKGYPYYPGSSMKGAFRRACTKEQADTYCGKERSLEELAQLPDSTSSSQPGILRFHGGYPIDNEWADPDRLVDLIHCQSEKQVIQDCETSANVQISLYRIKMKFGISSTKKSEQLNWDEIWQIWEKALGYGLGSRVSAGYGYFVDLSAEEPKFFWPERTQLEIKLKGQGLASNLLKKSNKSGEFRPNLFKATLRGHTLRLLGGMTNDTTALQLTKILWGGIGEQQDNNANSQDAVEGLLGVAFEYDPNVDFIDKHCYTPEGKVNQTSMPVYKLSKGILRIFSMKPSLATEEQQEIIDIAESLVKFSMLLGGFGKSWRRVYHPLFFNSYLKNKTKPTIGCHWRFIEGSKSLYIPIKDLNDDSQLFGEIANFIDLVRQRLQSWASHKVVLGNTIAANWREAWYRGGQQGKGVQVWGRIANNQNDSLAVRWFHNCDNTPTSLKTTSLGGRMGQTGRIWHRMYPLFQEKQAKLEDTKQYVELITIFPDDTPESKKFITFLEDSKNQLGSFQKIW